MHTPQRNIRSRVDDFLDRSNALVKGEKRLTRGSGSLTGVCEGLGNYFHVNPLYFRIGFVATSFLSGIGLLAYAALAIILPKGGGREPFRSPRSRRIETQIREEEKSVLDHRICPTCDTVGKANARFCHQCGSPL